jgi:hypothetical protein
VLLVEFSDFTHESVYVFNHAQVTQEYFSLFIDKKRKGNVFYAGLCGYLFVRIRKEGKLHTERLSVRIDLFCFVCNSDSQKFDILAEDRVFFYEFKDLVGVRRLPLTNGTIHTEKFNENQFGVYLRQREGLRFLQTQVLLYVGRRLPIDYKFRQCGAHRHCLAAGRKERRTEENPQTPDDGTHQGCYQLFPFHR